MKANVINRTETTVTIEQIRHNINRLVNKTDDLQMLLRMYTQINRVYVSDWKKLEEDQKLSMRA